MAILEQQITPQSGEACEDAGWRDSLKRRKQWTHEECLQRERAELLTEQYELLDGEIVFKRGQNLPHAQAVMRVLRALAAVFGLDRLLSQLPLMLSETRSPEPDATVLIQAFETYSGLATGKDALLVVEVSDATLRTDRDYKMRMYAQASIAEYWIVNIPGRILEVHRKPGPGGYADIFVAAEEGTVQPLAASEAVVSVKDLLP